MVSVCNVYITIKFVSGKMNVTLYDYLPTTHTIRVRTSARYIDIKHIRTDRCYILFTSQHKVQDANENKQNQQKNEKESTITES